MADVWRIVLRHDAEKTLAKLPKGLRERMARAIDELSTNPRPPSSIKLVGYADLYRQRVGDWRIIYTVQDDRLIVLVIEIAPRGSAYRDLQR